MPVPNVIRLPRHLRVHRGRCVIERCQLPVRADVHDVRLVRQIHDTGTVHQGDHAIDERQLTHDVQEITYDATHQAEQPAAIGLGSDLCSGLGSRRILHDYLYRLGGVIPTQFGRNLGVIGIAECDRHQQTKQNELLHKLGSSSRAPMPSKACGRGRSTRLQLFKPDSWGAGT